MGDDAVTTFRTFESPPEGYSTAFVVRMKQSPGAGVKIFLKAPILEQVFKQQSNGVKVNMAGVPIYAVPRPLLPRVEEVSFDALNSPLVYEGANGNTLVNLTFLRVVGAEVGVGFNLPYPTSEADFHQVRLALDKTFLYFYRTQMKARGFEVALHYRESR